MAKTKRQFIAAAAEHLADTIEKLPWAPSKVPGRHAVPSAGTPSTTLFSVVTTPSPFQNSLRISVTGNDVPPVITLKSRHGEEITRLKSSNPVWTPDATITPGVYKVRVEVDDKIVEKVVFYKG